ncbi:PCI domain-containing protein [Balamuthia mandrillaris]
MIQLESEKYRQFLRFPELVTIFVNVCNQFIDAVSVYKQKGSPSPSALPSFWIRILTTFVRWANARSSSTRLKDLLCVLRKILITEKGPIL